MIISLTVNIQIINSIQKTVLIHIFTDAIVIFAPTNINKYFIIVPFFVKIIHLKVIILLCIDVFGNIFIKSITFAKEIKHQITVSYKI